MVDVVDVVDDFGVFALCGVDLGDWLRDARKSFLMTQEVVAGIVGVSQSEISLYECGRVRPPDDVFAALVELYR